MFPVSPFLLRACTIFVMSEQDFKVFNFWLLIKMNPIYKVLTELYILRFLNLFPKSCLNAAKILKKQL